MTEKSQPGLGSGALREALVKLSNEASGMLGLSGVREAIGNTNMACLQLRVDEARALLSLSSPIEPAYTLDDKLRALHEDNVNISQMLVMLAKDVHGLARPIPQASSEIRERKITSAELQELARLSKTCFDGGNHLFWQNLADKLNKFYSSPALAPSRQGAAKRVEG